MFIVNRHGRRCDNGILTVSCSISSVGYSLKPQQNSVLGRARCLVATNRATGNSVTAMERCLGRFGCANQLEGLCVQPLTLLRIVTHAPDCPLQLPVTLALISGSILGHLDSWSWGTVFELILLHDTCAGEVPYHVHRAGRLYHFCSIQQ